MKKTILLTTSFIVAAFVSFSQDDITLCHASSTEKFAFFASSKDFNVLHARPRKYVHVSEAGGKMIRFTCADGKDGNGYVIMADKKTNNWIFVFQEWWGLNDNIKRHSEELFKDLGNVNVLALDMYDGNLATTPEAAGKFMQEFKQERGDMIVKGALEYVGKSAKIGTVGWCFGGGQSLLAALTSDKQAAACVIYYGMPVEDVEKLKKLHCDVLNIWPTKDKWINKEMMDTFEANMKKAGKKLTTKPYDADHAFANPSNPMGTYNEAAAKDAYTNTLAFFKATLK
jgi:carboxymethylenebutenolidase